ncbi:TonB-dependent receptor [Psychrobacter pygoscelis]|uniref:TonB-dependent receptor n=1 Tax=Psychrobacter pygoscelis TaxID=2488563 RepID=UPI00103FBF8A|nr:TonB-dependent receptor [Psychrobacter pygoscelis]
MGGSRESNIYIRGIGPGLFTDPTVGYYVDGVNLTSSGMFDIDMDNVERVEVLKGPQGTLYGGNSLGGVINVITKEPSNYSEGSASISVDNLSEKNLKLYYSSPIIEDELFWNIHAKGTSSDGYLTNVFNNSDYGAKKEVGFNTKLVWQPSDTLDMSLGLDYEKTDNDSYALGSYEFISKNPKKIDNDYRGEDDRKSYGMSFSVNKKILNDIKLTSITGWRKLDSFNTADQDAGSNPLFSWVSKTNEQNTQLTQELRLSSDNEQALSWIVGAYGYKNEYKIDSRNDVDYTLFGGGGPYVDLTDITKDNSGIALFGQADYHITPKLTLTGGLRLDREKRKADININNQSAPSVFVEGTEEFDAWLPKVGASYQFKNDAMVYASYNKGYRAGGFDHLYPSPNKPTYNKETSSNYEIGYKGSFFDNKLDLTTALFWIDIKDQQVQQILPSSGQISTVNSGKSTSKGIELNAKYKISYHWLVDGGISYNSAKYDNYEGCSLLGTDADCSGNHMIYAPEFTGLVGVEYFRALNNNLNLFTRAEAIYTGDYYYDTQNEFKQDPYTLVNAKLGVESDSWEAYIWLKNALDEKYSSVEYDFGAGHTSEAAKPRSFGIGLKRYF